MASRKNRVLAARCCRCSSKANQPRVEFYLWTKCCVVVPLGCVPHAGAILSCTGTHRRYGISTGSTRIPKLYGTCTINTDCTRAQTRLASTGLIINTWPKTHRHAQDGGTATGHTRVGWIDPENGYTADAIATVNANVWDSNPIFNHKQRGSGLLNTSCRLRSPCTVFLIACLSEKWINFNLAVFCNDKQIHVLGLLQTIEFICIVVLLSILTGCFSAVTCV